MIFQTLITLAPILVLLLFAALVSVLQLIKRGSSTLWITAVLGALFAWLFIFLNHQNLQIGNQILPWNLINQIDFSPTIQYNNVSWPYAVAVSTVLLSSMLISIINDEGGKWVTWMMSLILGALGLLAVLALNPITLVLAWAALDVCVLFVVVALEPDVRARGRAVIAFSVNISAVALLSWISLIENQVSGEGLQDNLEMYIGVLAFVVIGLRVAGITTLSPVISKTNFSKSLSSLLYLVPAAAAFALFNTIRKMSLSLGVEHLLVFLIGLIVCINALLWVWKPTSFRYQHIWIIMLAGFVTVSFIRGNVDASLAWGVALIYSGGILFLVSVKHRFIFILAAISLMSISMLPYTPSWPGAQLFAPPFYWGQLLLLISHVLILLGFAQVAQKTVKEEQRYDRFTWAIYFWGLFLLPITHIFMGFLARDMAPLGLSRWLGFLSSAAAMSIFLVHYFFPKLQIWSLYRNRQKPVLQMSINFSWLWRSTWPLYRGLDRGVNLLTQVMEGDGGILWTLLLLVLFITLIRQFS